MQAHAPLQKLGPARQPGRAKQIDRHTFHPLPQADPRCFGGFVQAALCAGKMKDGAAFRSRPGSGRTGAAPCPPEPAATRPADCLPQVGQRAAGPAKPVHASCRITRLQGRLLDGRGFGNSYRFLNAAASATIWHNAAHRPHPPEKNERRVFRR
jgi:hypothetical protein